MSESTPGVGQGPRSGGEVRLCLTLLAIGFVCCFVAVKHYRSLGQEPRFYQENFGPAVMMACGYGFTAPPAATSPASLSDFLMLRTGTFRCADFDAALVPERVTWNGTWIYLYGTVALIWRVTGISWTALDGLAATLGAIELVALYGLFRLVASRRVSLVSAFLVLLAPFNRDQLMMLRDFSKAPFVLAGVWVLARMILTPMGKLATIGHAVLFGVIVGLGYGFRSDLMVMVPFGAAAIVLFLPGAWRANWGRNLSAATAALLAFVMAGWMPLQGQRTGGCQFHYALLGLTSPLTDHMNVMSPLYDFGDHFLDTFVDLKVGDYANRINGGEPPILCSPDYDRESGALFAGMVTTFPADMVVHAYGSVLTILRTGLPIGPVEGMVGRVPYAFVAARPIDRLLNIVGMAGPFLALAAVGIAWSMAPRLGLALTVFILFLTGYPAIEFEARHWFHLRFLPLWTALVVWGAWTGRRSQPGRVNISTGALAAAATVALLVVAVVIARGIQAAPVAALITSYLQAPTEPIATSELAPSTRAVAWNPPNFGVPPTLRSSDLLVLTVSPMGCGASGPVDVKVIYDAPLPSHDLTSTIRVERDNSGPTRVFFPVFALGHMGQTYLRFTSIEVPGRPADCLTDVSRVTDRTLPLWVQLQVPADWSTRPYYQSLKTPRFLRFLE